MRELEDAAGVLEWLINEGKVDFGCAWLYAVEDETKSEDVPKKQGLDMMEQIRAVKMTALYMMEAR